MELLEDIEGHSKDEKNIRRIYKVVVSANIVPTTPAPSPSEPQKNENVFTVYISGIDTGGSVSKRSRSDVNIVATINMETGQILLVSTPRDYFVPLSISNGKLDKLTHAGIYGVDVSKATIGMLYDTEIDYYFKVNFDGFKEIIDALGGITVNSQFNFGNGIYNKGNYG
jgi:anionic cell wall polymer biosynthesis LytR-Cps2A-Psr (LCP) family protein